ncbi:MAG TPA: branched-chain amino acid ABC transporter permease [Anaerolineae bacterium]|nr:branched-chain amino acid ABC transporter permease [Anaerolineae bacterium]
MRQNRNKYLQYIFGVIIVILLILLPFYGGEYTITTFIRIIYFGFLALSMGWLIGQGGMVSFTQTAFFGIAGYVIGLFGFERGWQFPLADIFSIIVVLLFALVFGMIAMRTEKIVLLMITLAFGQVVWAFALQQTTVLHGWAGIRGIRPYLISGINFLEKANFYWAALILFGLGIFFLWRFTHSPFGLALNGTRENTQRMAALGYPVYWIRLVAFLIAAIYAALGGILATYNTGVITPTYMQLSRTMWVLLMVILGGANYFWGPVVGTVVAVWLDVLVSQSTERYNTIIGIIFVFTVLFSPSGILGILNTIRKSKKLMFLNSSLHQKKE